MTAYFVFCSCPTCKLSRKKLSPSTEYFIKSNSFFNYSPEDTPNFFFYFENAFDYILAKERMQMFNDSEKHKLEIKEVFIPDSFFEEEKKSVAFFDDLCQSNRPNISLYFNEL